ncbi:Hypothetical_protein [Hexamita inflata]|uniref:Hypothetical_protein n=1 Tax=Hexamita inflata TaxID=28002 RepID=A0AA86UA70_9EUKA|nr:Hypothetical protein HINF_LOCUS10271 [Hexamita inflata]CAI9947349.1 Hypothetical protein HINF_LOCUS34994 [Hexamita inflata]
MNKELDKSMSSRPYASRPGRTWDDQLDKQLQEIITRVFEAHFNTKFNNYEELVQYYNTLQGADMGRCWVEVSKEMGMKREQVCKRFINNHVKQNSQQWPMELWSAVMQDVEQQIISSQKLNLQLERKGIITDITAKYDLKSFTQYHYPTIYNNMYNRITQLQEQYLKEQPPQPPQIPVPHFDSPWMLAQINLHNKLIKTATTQNEEVTNKKNMEQLQEAFDQLTLTTFDGLIDQLKIVNKVLDDLEPQKVPKHKYQQFQDLIEQIAKKAQDFDM